MDLESEALCFIIAVLALTHHAILKDLIINFDTFGFPFCLDCFLPEAIT